MRNLLIGWSILALLLAAAPAGAEGRDKEMRRALSVEPGTIDPVFYDTSGEAN